MHWNYRVCQYMGEGQTLFCIRKVYYEPDGSMRAHSDVSADACGSVEDLQTTVTRMQDALALPVIVLTGDV